VSNDKDHYQWEVTHGWFERQPRLVRRALLCCARISALTMRTLFGNCCRDGFGILMYHRIAMNVRGVAKPTFNVTPESLRRQLSGLLARGFECWPLQRLVDAKREMRSIAPNVFAITFDDGYENNYLQAWPILRELNLPATIFVATKYLDSDQPFPMDDWSAAGTDGVPESSWRPLSTKQCQEMIASGLIEIGAHTHSHESFLGNSGKFREDMNRCLAVLQERLGIQRPSFAFPFGDIDPDLVDAVRQLDVSCGLSTTPRRVRASDDEFHWGRFCVFDNDTPGFLAAKLSGWYSRVIETGGIMMSPFVGLVEESEQRGELRSLRIGNFERHGAGEGSSSP
jgi:peptidoglycan/xylan/chitin deacetylase (PgdA/CDA1 family)